MLAVAEHQVTQAFTVRRRRADLVRHHQQTRLAHPQTRGVRVCPAIRLHPVMVDGRIERGHTIERGAELPERPDYSGAAQIERPEALVVEDVVARMAGPETTLRSRLRVRHDRLDRVTSPTLVPLAVRQLLVLVRAPQQHARMIT